MNTNLSRALANTATLAVLTLVAVGAGNAIAACGTQSLLQCVTTAQAEEISATDVPLEATPATPAIPEAPEIPVVAPSPQPETVFEPAPLPETVFEPAPLPETVFEPPPLQPALAPPAPPTPPASIGIPELNVPVVPDVPTAPPALVLEIEPENPIGQPAHWEDGCPACGRG